MVEDTAAPAGPGDSARILPPAPPPLVNLPAPDPSSLVSPRCDGPTFSKGLPTIPSAGAQRGKPESGAMVGQPGGTSVEVRVLACVLVGVARV